MYKYIQKSTSIPKFLPFPKFLLELPLTGTTKILYTLLLDRTKLSCNNDGWTDSAGNVYINYTIDNLAKALGKGESTIKDSLKKLSDTGLIVRRQQGPGKPNRIYVRLPEDEKLPVKQPEKSPDDGQESGCQGAEKKLQINGEKRLMEVK